MDSARKRRFFALLLELGIPEIEVGFPAASKTDFDFVRVLIEEDLVPSETTIAVLTQARPELIERSFEAVAGARRAIVHLYNSTSVTQRRVVFRLDRDGITDLAVRGTRLCKELAAAADGEIVFQYSPESFHHTELDYALEICEAVAEEWRPTPEQKMIVNLPTTVEQFPPNVYADRIEWFGRHFSKRDSAIGRIGVTCVDAAPECSADSELATAGRWPFEAVWRWRNGGRPLRAARGERGPWPNSPEYSAGRG